jgi:hypothetical protein
MSFWLASTFFSFHKHIFHWSTEFWISKSSFEFRSRVLNFEFWSRILNFEVKIFYKLYSCCHLPQFSLKFIDANSGSGETVAAFQLNFNRILNFERNRILNFEVKFWILNFWSRILNFEVSFEFWIVKSNFEFSKSGFEFWIFEVEFWISK